MFIEEKQVTVFELDVLKSIYEDGFSNQRILSEQSGYSLGTVNKSIKHLIDQGMLTEDISITTKANKFIEAKSPRNAIILAAGFGMRMVPINLETPKAFIEVNGEKLIERQIRQLHEADIHDITIVVGFMKESFEYLVDMFNVKLVVNNEYAQKNNLYSLAKVVDDISNTYIIPCDIWCENNPFGKNELYSWYMVSDLVDDFSMVRVNRKLELIRTNEATPGNEMIGIAYLADDNTIGIIKKKVKESASSDRNKKLFWEEALFDKDRFVVSARIVQSTKFIEINTYEQLRDLDSKSAQLNNEAIIIAAKALNVSTDDITDIKVLKKGMTNRSFIFKAKENQYIMRIPGEGTDKLINRQNEASVYEAIHDKGLCDDPIYINPQNGFKITRYLHGVRTCNIDDDSDLQKCMQKLRAFHSMHISVPHEFDIVGQIDFYESLWGGALSVYHDYSETKKNVLSLCDFVNEQKKDYCLTHIDAVPDNFLFCTGSNGHEELQLTDWEYSGMQDPHVDIAMFCIYSLFNKEQVDKLIDIYFEEKCPTEIRIKIYCYISLCGLLWSNWCEYKRSLGVEFGEYSLRQYRYAKEYYRIAKKMIER